MPPQEVSTMLLTPSKVVHMKVRICSQRTTGSVVFRLGK